MDKNALYLHIPFCVKKCLYCDFVSYEGRLSCADRYINALLREAELRAEEFSSAPYASVFLGGGTPSLLTGAQMQRLMAGLRSRLPFAPDAEISMEANPGTVDREKLTAFREAGINRISFGVQAIQDPLLARLGRIHRFRDAQRAVDDAKVAGFTRVNLDFMTGLPGQGRVDLRESLIWALSQGVGHISLYSLIVEEGTPFYRLYEAGELALPDEEQEREVFHEACTLLENAGLSRYEISNFARPGEECRHNIRYWKRQDYLGLGVAAVSQCGPRRIKNPDSLEDYLASLDTNTLPEQEKEEVSPSDLAFETVMLALRMTVGLDLAAFARRFGENAAFTLRTLGEKWQTQGFARLTDTHLSLTDAGLDVQNTLLVEAWEALEGLDR